MEMASIAPVELQQKIESKEDVLLIDIRSSADFSSVHAAGSVNVPMGVLDKSHVPSQNDKEVFLFCKGGVRVKTACTKLMDAGAENVVVVEGGTDAWVAANLPVNRGKNSMSLERQVRIAAGALVLTGVGLSFLHIGFISISAFVGAGLMFAGITDFCGIGLLLAKCPWNR